MASFLVVDDSVFMRIVIKNVLEEAGHKVIAEASNGLEAVRKYIDFSPDIVTMDITLERMTGIEALREIKKINQNAKVIMCSSVAHQYKVMEALRAGAIDFIPKPINKGKLIDIIARVNT